MDNKSTRKLIEKAFLELDNQYYNSSHKGFYNTLKKLLSFKGFVKNDTEIDYGTELSLIFDSDLDLEEFENTILNSLFDSIKPTPNTSAEDEESNIETFKLDCINNIKNTTIEFNDVAINVFNIIDNLTSYDLELKDANPFFMHKINEAKSYLISFIESLSENDLLALREDLLLSSADNHSFILKTIKDINSSSFVFSEDSNFDPFTINENNSISIASSDNSDFVDLISFNSLETNFRTIFSSGVIESDNFIFFMNPAKVYLISKKLEKFFKTPEEKYDTSLNNFFLLKSIYANTEKSKEEKKLLKNIKNIISIEASEIFDVFRASQKSGKDTREIDSEDIKLLLANNFNHFFDIYDTELTKSTFRADENKSLAYSLICDQKSTYRLRFSKNAIEDLFNSINLQFLHIENFKTLQRPKFIDTFANDFFSLMQIDSINNEQTMFNSLSALTNISKESKYSSEFLNELLFSEWEKRNVADFVLLLTNIASDSIICTDHKWVDKFDIIIGRNGGYRYAMARGVFEQHARLISIRHNIKPEPTNYLIKFNKIILEKDFLGNSDKKTLEKIYFNTDIYSFFTDILSDELYELPVLELLEDNEFCDLVRYMNSSAIYQLKKIHEERRKKSEYKAVESVFSIISDKGFLDPEDVTASQNVKNKTQFIDFRKNTLQQDKYASNYKELLEDTGYLYFICLIDADEFFIAMCKNNYYFSDIDTFYPDRLLSPICELLSKHGEALNNDRKTIITKLNSDLDFDQEEVVNIFDKFGVSRSLED